VKKIALIGGGSWASALAKLLTDNQLPITWWVRDSDQAESIQKEGFNPKYLSSVHYPTSLLTVTTDVTLAFEGADFIILAVPAAFLRSSLRSITPEDFRNKVIVSAIKGMIPETKQIVAEFLGDHYSVDPSQMLVIAGPCHAEEVAEERLSYLTIAGREEIAQEFASMLAGKHLKTKTSEDLIGTEYAAVLKNIYALACGIAKGLGYGDNFQAVLVSSAVGEMKRITKNIYKVKRKMHEPAYLGDLLVTAYSQYSRNRTFGNMIGRGYSVASAKVELGMVAEGYFATPAIRQICLEKTIKAPIVEAVYQSLYEGNAKKAFKKLEDQIG
jgi:glycerol-3-phosphate dehydrogenase (NAD(P)+)